MVFFIEQHVYRHSSDEWRFISVTLKNSKVKYVSMMSNMKLLMLLEARVIRILCATNIIGSSFFKL